YDDEGHVFKQAPRKGKLTGKGLSNHQFFNRFAESFIAEISRLAPEGSLYRIDLRLRPEGDAGPLTRSLAGYENYYAQWGQTWERMMLIKARCVAGDRALAGEFLETIHPFRYPRSLGERVLHEVAAMKQRIEEEVLKAGEVERNVKLGRGGIREIEFIIQTMQLLHAGRQPFLQGAQSLPLLEKLAQYKILPEEDTHRLAEAYRFLRQVEHRLQMEDDRQTHTLPQDKRALERLARLMRFPAATEFETERARHTAGVRAIYGRLLQAPESRPDELLPRDFEGHETRWKELLAGHGFQDVEKALNLTRMFMQGPGYLHFSSRTLELARLLFPKLLELCPTPDRLEKLAGDDHKILSDPDRVLARLDSFIRAYGARATLYETWAGNPTLFELWLLLFDRSEYLAEIAIRTPDLVDELELSGRLRRQKAAGDTLADLRYGLEDKDQRLWLRRYHQTELMRIGLRDILGLADFEQNLDELTALADACLAYAMEVVQHRHRLKAPPFCVAGLGKLGGREINYGSDLDVVFIADAKVGDLPKLQPLATEIMQLLSSTTEYGVAFQLDARLRPDGEKGLMVNTLAAYEEYYRHRAMLWEIQSLTRVRAVAGDLKTGRAFEKLAARLTNFSKPSRPLAAFTGDWMAQIARMRERIEKERTPAGKDHLAIKTGCGGLIDAEFVAQAMCLRHGWQEANTLRALERLRGSDHLSDRNADQLITSYRKIRRIEGILRRWSFVGETVLPDDPAPLHRVALRCGFEGTDSFMKALGASRQALRQVYEKVFDSRPKPARSRKK
ncbi:MAG TPA: hypothetical protein VMS21_14250, partial [Methylomirabilota bacterium]|nr:hypothetical protein [Methylomirabilota bacterium]